VRVRVFGPGCANCRRLEAAAREALDALAYSYELTKVETLPEIAAAGVLRTPALEIDGRVVLQGRVPGVAELKYIFEKAAAATGTALAP
jgi:small redox-active disulfide protein 2